MIGRSDTSSPLLEGDRLALARIANAIPQIVWVADSDGNIFYYNDSWYETTGLTRATIASREDWRATVHPDDYALVLAAWDRATVRQEPYEIEHRLRRIPGGDYRWFLARGRPLFDLEGKLVRWFGTTTDIDYHKRFLAASEERVANLRTIVEAIPHMVWTARPDGYIDYYSERFLAYLQTLGEGLVERGSTEIIHPDDVAIAGAAWAQSVSAGTAYEAELRLKRARDGTYRWFHARALPYVGADGRIERWIGTATDVDEEHRLAERRETLLETLTRTFVPSSLPDFAPYTLEAVYVPAEEDARVGGDFFDAVVLPSGELLFVIGDVAGHGAAAAVVMSRARNALVTLALDIDDPATLLERANRVLLLQGDTMVTAIVGFLRRDGAFRYATAGHPPPLLVSREAQPRLLETHGAPLGILPAIAPRTFYDRLPGTSLLLLYTDGIVEYDRNIEAGERRLLAATESALGHALPAAAILRTLLGTRRAPDDIALLTLARAAD